jgi:hypothetical protein
MNWALARRDLLKKLGLGAAWLPLLRATGARAEAAPTKKLICVMAIQGYRQAAWRPKPGPLDGQSLPKSTSPLEPHRSDLLFATELAHRGATGNAAYGTSFWGLPDVRGDGTYKEPNGKTLDQVVGEQLPRGPGARTSFAFGVQLDLPPRITFAGGNRCFWAGPGQPVAPILDPQVAYQALFGTAQATDGAALERLRFQRKTVLDYVDGSLRRFAARVSTVDRQIIDAHLGAIRELERNVDRALSARCITPPAASLDLANTAHYPLVLKAHTSLMVAALACGVTRVVTLQLADASGFNINFGAFVPGIPAVGTGYKSPFRNWADLAHNPVMNGVDHKQLVDQWWMERLGELIARLKATPDAAGTSLFDNSVILWANPVEDGANHDSSKMPWLLAGRAGGALRTGQHLAAGGAFSSGVLAAVCQALGVTVHPFGAPLPGLLV